MAFNVDRQIKGYGKRNKRRRAWKRGLAALCCVAAVGAVYGLARPALTAERDAYCGVEEHTHTVEDGCYALICGMEESPEGHVHTEACYETQSVLVCGMEEGPAESPAETAEPAVVTEQTVVTEKVLACGQEESAGHTHGDGCYTTVTTLTCGQEESAGHAHTDECYDGEGNLVCGLEESAGHTHSDGCYTTETTLTCGMEESAGHTHTDECYTEQTVVIETAESAAPEPAAEDAAPPHVHTDECYETQEVLVCGMEEAEPHEHTGECYGELICEKEEHTHTLPCFSDPGADLDTAEQWRAKAHAVELTGDYAADLIAVAESQLGYTESAANYIVLDDGETVKGYTLYGAWYGDAYGDWCAMFVSFCLDAAGISREAIPYEASCPRWAAALAEPEWALYRSAAAYTPEAGDIVFFDWDQDGDADHVGIVADYTYDENGEITGIVTVEGNSGNAVRKNEYTLANECILGYGALPENPETAEPVEEPEPEPAGEVKTYLYEDEHISVTAVPESPDALPEDAVLKVTRVDADAEGYNYDAYMQALNDSAGEAVYTAENTILYDIAFLAGPDGEEPADGQEAREYQPAAGQVAVSFTFKDDQLSQIGADGETDVSVVHLPLAEEVRSQVPTTSDATEISADNVEVEAVSAQVEEQEVRFSLDGFSLTAVTTASTASVENAPGTFTYEGNETDGTSGLTVTLKLDSTSYTEDDYTLVVEKQDSDNYSQALSTFTSHGPVISESVIYKISLIKTSDNSIPYSLSCAYEIEFKWNDGLFVQSLDGQSLSFTYIDNSSFQNLTTTDVTYESGGNITALTASGWMSYTKDFMFLSWSSPNGLKADKYTLKKNTVKDAFITESEYAKYYNANSPIGTAGSFHIVAFDTATLSSHTNGNVLAKTLIAEANFGTNNYQDELTYVQNYQTVSATSASNEKHVLALGSNNTISIEDNGNALGVNGKKIDNPKTFVQDEDTDTAPLIDLNRVKTEINQIAQNLAGYKTANLTYTTGDSFNTLRLTNPNAVGVAHYTVAELSNLGNYLQINGFQSNHNGTVVINVDCSNASEINLPQARIVIDGQEVGVNEVKEFSAGKVIWNFTNAQGVTINTHLMTGIILAPGATVNINQNLNGTVVAENINVKAESHRTDFTGKIIDTTDDDDCTYHITVQKVETGYVGTAVAGAKFKLYKWNGTTWEHVRGGEIANNDTTPDILTSGNDGTFMLHHLDKDTAYRLEEIVAPARYKINEVPYFDFWIRTDTNKTEPDTMPEGFIGTPVDAGGVLQAANEKDDGSEVIEPPEEVYTLPETGGSGTGVYMAAGLTACLLAGAVLLTRRKRSRAGRSS